MIVIVFMNIDCMENVMVIKVNFCIIFDYVLYNGKYVGIRDENFNYCCIFYVINVCESDCCCYFLIIFNF